MQQKASSDELLIVENSIKEVCAEIATLLIEKNKKYGNSALSPLRIFSKASAEEQINVRIDDKLSRIAQGHGYDKNIGSVADEDTEQDLIGYLVLKRVQRKINKQKK